MSRPPLSRLSRLSLPLWALVACTPNEPELPLDEPAVVQEHAAIDESLAEQDGLVLPAATWPRTEDPERHQQLEQRLDSACAQQRAQGPVDRPVTLARGVTEPRFRVVEDQAEAGLRLLEQGADAEASVLPVDPGFVEAQARYLEEAAALDSEWSGSVEARAEARAQLKAQILDEP